MSTDTPRASTASSPEPVVSAPGQPPGTAPARDGGDPAGAAAPLEAGLLLFPGITQLDLTGPWEVLRRIPGMRCHTVWRERGVVVADSGLGLVASTAFDECPPLDLVLVPGGGGQLALMDDAVVLGFLRAQGERARWVTSVCTGSLLLGAAGLLRGYRAACHWAYADLLALVGATHVDARVVVDRNRITAGGVTAGIDFALQVAAELGGDALARRIALEIEYDPAPPVPGHPRSADPALVATLRAAVAASLAERGSAVARAVGCAGGASG